MADHNILEAISSLSKKMDALEQSQKEARQDRAVANRTIAKLTDVIEILKAATVEIAEWTQSPPSTDLGDTMRELLLGQQNVHGTLVHLGNEVRAVPRRVANELELREGDRP